MSGCGRGVGFDLSPLYELGVCEERPQVMIDRTVVKFLEDQEMGVFEVLAFPLLLERETCCSRGLGGGHRA